MIQPHQLYQLKVKLLNDINASYYLAENLKAEEVAKRIDEDVDSIFDALRGCESCAGSGYLLSGLDYKLCTCYRGEKLAEFIKHYQSVADSQTTSIRPKTTSADIANEQNKPFEDKLRDIGARDSDGKTPFPD